MKIYLQTITETSEGAEERPRQLVLETAAGQPAVAAALDEISGRLGVITVIPPAAHEHNLKQVLPRDLAAAGILPGKGASGDESASFTLEVRRQPGTTGAAGQADVIGLSYLYTFRDGN